jgi:hypothetical protein
MHSLRVAEGGGGVIYYRDANFDLLNSMCPCEMLLMVNQNADYKSLKIV